MVWPTAGARLSRRAGRGLGTFAVVLAMAGAAPPSRAESRLDQARQYLLSTRTPGGAFAGAPIVDTVEAIQALAPGAALDDALFAAAQTTPDNREAAIVGLIRLSGPHSAGVH